MKKLSIIKNCQLITLSSCLLMTGCSNIHSNMNKTGAGVFSWQNDVSAAIILPSELEGDMKKPTMGCMQNALAIRNIDSSVQASLSDATGVLAEKIKQLSSTEPNPQALAEARASLKIISQALNTTTERTSFLMIGAFYICQMQANGMPHEMIQNLTQELIITAAKLVVEPSVTKDIYDNEKAISEVNAKKLPVTQSNNYK